jgi:hypothetical protein
MNGRRQFWGPSTVAKTQEDLWEQNWLTNWQPPDTSRELFDAALRTAKLIEPRLWEEENPVLTVSLCRSYTGCL